MPDEPEIPEVVQNYLDASKAAKHGGRHVDIRQKRAELSVYDAITAEGALNPDIDKLNTAEGREQAYDGAKKYIDGTLGAFNPNYGNLDRTDQLVEAGFRLGGVTAGKIKEVMDATKDGFDLEHVLKDQTVQQVMGLTQQLMSEDAVAAQRALTPEAVINYAGIGDFVTAENLLGRYDKMGTLVSATKQLGAPLQPDYVNKVMGWD